MFLFRLGDVVRTQTTRQGGGMAFPGKALAHHGLVTWLGVGLAAYPAAD